MIKWTDLIFPTSIGQEAFYGTKRLVVRPVTIGGWWRGVYELGDLLYHGIEEDAEEARYMCETLAKYGPPNLAEDFLPEVSPTHKKVPEPVRDTSSGTGELKPDFHATNAKPYLI